MTIDEIKEYCKNKHKVTEEFPFGDVPISIDIATGKYYYDLEVKDVSTSVDDRVRKFFGEILPEV